MAYTNPWCILHGKMVTYILSMLAKFSSLYHPNEFVLSEGVHTPSQAQGLDRPHDLGVGSPASFSPQPLNTSSILDLLNIFEDLELTFQSIKHGILLIFFFFL